MSTPPSRRPGHDDVSGNHSHPPSVLKFPHDDHSSAVGGKVVGPSSSRHDYHAPPPPYDVGVEGRMPKIAQQQRNESDRRSPLPQNMLFRVSTPASPADHVSTENRMEFKVDNNREAKSETRELQMQQQQQTAKSDKHADENKDSKHEPKGNEKMNKDGGYNSGSNSQLNWKDMKEQQHRVKQHSDVPAADTWHVPPRSDIAAKESLHVDSNNRDIGEAIGENMIDNKGDDKFKDRKRKEVKQHWDHWGERDKDRRNNNFQPPGSSEHKESVKEERESERWGNEKKEQKEKLNEKEKDHVKKELWSSIDREEASHNEKEVIGKSVAEQENSALEPKKKDHDAWKNVDKKERDTDHVESERPEKRSRYHEKELDEGGMLVDGVTEREREVFNSGQRKRMLRPRSSPQMGNNPRHRAGANDNEGLHGKSDVSCVAYKTGECMQELVKLWNAYECMQADKACEGSQNGPTLEIRIPAEHVTATNRQVRGGQLWGTDVYTVDSDLVAVLMHTGYCRPTASPPPPATQELRATIRVLPPQDCYISTLRNNVRSRAWGAAIGCSYLVERCCIVKKGGGIIDLEPCLTHSSTMEPTLAPVAVERTMTTRAAASNALRQQRFVREVTIQFNLCMEPWLKYSISAVADKGLKKSLFTSARLKKGEVLYVETHSRRYELCFNGEKVMKAHAHGMETGRAQTSSFNLHNHLCNGEKHVVDGDSNLADVFRWSRCKSHLPQKIMQSIGIPLPLDHVEVLEDNMEWDDISWSQTGAWIGGKEYHLARAHFLSPN